MTTKETQKMRQASITPRFLLVEVRVVQQNFIFFLIAFYRTVYCHFKLPFSFLLAPTLHH
jgi:hypothetical protein